MTTVAQAVDRVFRTYLYGTYDRTRNALASPVNVTDNTIELQFAKIGASKSGLIAIGRELCSILDVGSDQRHLTVIRAVDGTVAGNYAAGREVEINPRYGRGTIVEEMFWELKSWPEDVPRIVTKRIAVDRDATAFQVVDVDARVRHIYDVQRPSRSSLFGGTDLRGFQAKRERVAFDVATDGDVWVYLNECSPGTTYRVVLGTDWPVTLDSWSETTDLEDVGLTEGLIDVLVIGSTWRMIFAKEIRKLQLEAQGQARDTQEVPPSSFARLGLQLKSLRDGRLADERARLLTRWGFG